MTQPAPTPCAPWCDPAQCPIALGLAWSHNAPEPDPHENDPETMAFHFWVGRGALNGGSDEAKRLAEQELGFRAGFRARAALMEAEGA